MKKVCRDCRYFQTSEKMINGHKWGLCSRFGHSQTWGKCKHNEVFRWGDDTCKDFEHKEQSVKSHEVAEPPLK